MIEAEPLGPDTLTWKYFGDLRTAMLGTWVLVYQGLYPELGKAVIDHSTMTEEGMQRAIRSTFPVMGVVYDGPLAERTAREVVGYHYTVKGTHNNKRYHALASEVFYWAHATFFMQIIRTAELFCGGLTEDDKEQLYAEHMRWYRLYGVAARPMPESWARFNQYWQQILIGVLEMNPAVEWILDTRVDPKFRFMPTWFSTAMGDLTMAGSRWIATAAADHPVRAKAGLRWTTTDEWLFRLFAGLVRVTYCRMPQRWRMHPRAWAGIRQSELVHAPAWTAPISAERRENHYHPDGSNAPTIGAVILTVFLAIAGSLSMIARRT